MPSSGTIKRQKSESDGGKSFMKEVVLMIVPVKSLERKADVMSFVESLQLMLSFGIFILTLITVVIAIIKLSQNK